MPSETKPESFDFGVIVAFVAPGFLALRAAAYHLPTASAWLNAAQEKEQSVGVFFFALLASLSLGLVVSGIRYIVIDKTLECPLLRTFAVPSLELDWKKVTAENLPLLLVIRDNHYRYYQFYANSLVALVIFFVARATSSAKPLNTLMLSTIALSAFALLFSARGALKKYNVGVNRLLTP